MTEQASRADQADDPILYTGAVLRQHAEEMAQIRAVQTPEVGEALSPAAVQQVLPELRVHQIELEMQNEELRRIQTALEASRARYFDLYDLAPVGYFTVSEQGLISELNLTAAGLLGMARSALLKQPLSRFILPADQDVYYRRRRQLFATGAPQVWEMRLAQPDGAFFWAQADATVVQDSERGVPVCRLVITDITVRKQAETAAQEQRQFAEAVRDSLAALTGSHDIESVMQRLLDCAVIMFPSEAGCIILFEGNYGHVAYLRGFSSAAEAFFKDYWFPTSVITGGNALADRQAYFVPDTQADPTWITLPATAWVRSSMGVPIERRGEVIGLLVVDSATTHHFRPTDLEKLHAFARYACLALEKIYHVAELEARVVERTHALQATKEQVEAILNNTPDAILLVHPDLSIERTNTAFHRIFGYTATDDPAGSLYDLIHKDDVAGVNMVVQTVLRKQMGQQIEMRCYHKNGTLFNAELGISPSKGAGLVMTLRDITERKQNEKWIRQALEKQKEVVELKSRFVAMASHEFRTPLATLLFLTEMLSAFRHRLSDEQIELRLGKIKEQVSHLADIREDVLHLTWLQVNRAEFNLMPLDLDDLCRTVFDELQSQPAISHQILYTCAAPLAQRYWIKS